MEIARKKGAGFKRTRPKPVSAEAQQLVRSRFLPGLEAPLLLEPTLADIDAAGWGEANRAFIEGELSRHGALLFRGFGLASVPEFERFARAICPTLYGDYGDLPSAPDGEKVYQSTPYPADKTILFHNESSHMHRWPLRQLFFCVQPSEEGGETPLVDCRKIYHRLDPELRDLLERRGLLYLRNFIAGLDVAWQDFFKTDDRAEVEAYCRNHGIECEWVGENLWTRRWAPAVAIHPKTREKIFFNQIQLHHIACLEAEERASMLSLFGDEGLPRNVCYGDGSPLEDEVVQEILDLYWQEAVSFRWQRGDVVMVDNMLVAHARNPFRGSRRIAVAMGEMFSQQDLESTVEIPQ